MNPNSSSNELPALISRICDAGLSHDEGQQLDALLRSSAAARQCYYDFIELHAELLWTFGEPEARTSAAGLQPSQSPGLTFLGNIFATPANWLTMPKMLAILVSAGLVTYFALLFISVAMQRAWRADEALSAAASPAVARVTGLWKCRWADDSPIPRVGGNLPGKALHLVSGVVELESAEGVAIRLEGPARFDLRWPSVGVLDAGSLSARVPIQAVGFSIQTPTATVIDLGTEFGVAVAEKDGATYVQVITGQVEMQPKGDASEGRQTRAVRLTAGEARRIRFDEPTGESVIEPIRFDAGQYVGPSQRESTAESALDGRQTWSALVRSSAALAAYFPMNEPAGSKTARDAAGGRNDGSYHHGFARGGVTLGVAGPPVSEFPAFSSANTAAQFNGEPANGQQIDSTQTDYLEIDDITNLDSASYSFEVWFDYARTDVLQYIGGRGAEHHFEAVGLSGENLLFAGAGIPLLQKDKVVEVKPGVWHHLVYARQGATLRVYLDGELMLSGSTVESAYGTSNRIVAGMRPDNVLPFGGSLDELAIYNRALTGLEVRRHYEFGRRQP